MINLYKNWERKNTKLIFQEYYTEWWLYGLWREQKKNTFKNLKKEYKFEIQEIMDPQYKHKSDNRSLIFMSVFVDLTKTKSTVL